MFSLCHTFMLTLDPTHPFHLIQTREGNYLHDFITPQQLISHFHLSISEFPADAASYIQSASFSLPGGFDSFEATEIHSNSGLLPSTHHPFSLRALLLR